MLSHPVKDTMSDQEEQNFKFPFLRRYSTVEKECLAVKLGIEAFLVYLLGRHFVVETDHRALEWLDRL